MTKEYNNTTGVPLSVAVYLAVDHYDYVPNTISATGLMKPLRQHILIPRVPAELKIADVTSLVKSRIGTSIHDGLEKAWTGDHYKKAMLKLGYPESVINRIKVNPEPSELEPDDIPVYMEQRMFREFLGVNISGKFDFIAEGRLEDFKSTSTYTWTKDTKTEDYQLQGSIYRWLDQGVRITEDHMAIQFFFTDWAAGMAKQNPAYPQRQVEQKLIPLLNLDDTEAYISGKLNAIRMYKNTPENELPLCNDKELWRKDPVFKYYRDPAKRSRSTKNFDNMADAYKRLTDDGNKGIIVEVPGEVVACKYCAAFPICSQKDDLIADGSLIL